MPPSLVPFRKVDRWGYAGPGGSLVIPCEFDHAYPFHGIDVAHVTQGGKSGLMGRGGALVLPLEYDWIGDEDEGSFKSPGGVLLLRQEGRYGAASSTGEVLVEVGHEDPESALGAATRVLSERGPLPEGLARPVDPSVAGKYDEAGSYDCGMALVRRGELWGFVNEAGEEVIPPAFEEAYSFNEFGGAPVKRNGRFGHVDRSGATTTPFEYDDAFSFVGDSAIVVQGGRFGCVGVDGKPMIPCEFEEIGELQGGRAVASRAGRFGYVDSSGREVIPFQYDTAEAFVDGLARVSKDGRWGLLGVDGSEVVPLTCDPPDWDSGTFPESTEGRHPVRRDGKWGFVDGAGAEAVPCRFRWAWGFQGGLARVAIEDPKGLAIAMPGGGSPGLHLFGWIRPDGTEAIPMRYSLARDFEDGVARVESAETTLTGYIDRAGTEYWED